MLETAGAFAGLSCFGFFASRLLRFWPLAIRPSNYGSIYPANGPGFRKVPPDEWRPASRCSMRLAVQLAAPTSHPRTEVA